MIRKQLYLEARHDALLKHLAETRGISEAEAVRQALDASQPARRVTDQAAWDHALAFMRSLRGPAHPARRRAWRRVDAYRERLDRYARRPR